MKLFKILIMIGFGILGSGVLYCVGNLLYITYIISLKSFIFALGLIISIILISLGMILDKEKVKKK